MNSAITWQLLAVLLAAAILGVLIGLAVMRLLQVGRLKEAYNSRKIAVEKLTAQRDGVNAERRRILQVLESERKLGALARTKHSQLIAQSETLQAHTGLQARRLSQLDAKLHAAEEKNMRLERDFASFKMNKLREVSMLKTNANEWSDSENDASLNVDASQSKSVNNLNSEEVDFEEVDPDLTQPIIASELYIPSIAESDLPDTVDDLEFELADSSE